MLNDKHIDQWAGYLIEEYPRCKKLEEIICQHIEFEEIFIAMYKKGYQDCLEDNK